MRVQRVQQWQSRLNNYLEEVAYNPFRWGKHDCTLFVAGAINAMCEVDLAAAYRGEYASAREAAAALREHGAGTLQATVTAALGEPVPIAYAHRGDVVSLDNALGICVGRYSFFAGAYDEVGILDGTAQALFDEAEAGDLPDDQPEPELPLSLGRTLMPILTRSCDHAWRVGY